MKWYLTRVSQIARIKACHRRGWLSSCAPRKYLIACFEAKNDMRFMSVCVDSRSTWSIFCIIALLTLHMRWHISLLCEKERGQVGAQWNLSKWIDAFKSHLYCHFHCFLGTSECSNNEHLYDFQTKAYHYVYFHKRRLNDVWCRCTHY